jgi:ferredoxin-NADP reductase
VVELVDETPRCRTILLDAPSWAGHRAGQHVDVRLTAEDGYQAQRSYSVASGPEDPILALTVERLEDGEVSPYLVEELRPGDELELRGPIGGYFVWEPRLGGPLALIGGGSGVVPLMSMLRARQSAPAAVPTRLLYSVRSPDEVIYRRELDALDAADPSLQVSYTFTRQAPPGWAGYARRVDASMLGEVVRPAGERPLVYVCGPTGFVEAVARVLVEMGHAAQRVRTERFGPTGS